MPDWSELFSLTTPLLEILIRGTVMFFAIFALMRLTGKRESGVHSISDLLVVVLVAQAAANGMAGDSTGILDSIVLIVTVLGWSVAIDAAAYYVPALRPMLKSKPSPLVVDGRLNHRALRREFMDPDELMAELRLHGITELEEVARAYLETNGMVSVIRNDHQENDEPDKPSVPV